MFAKTKEDIAFWSPIRDCNAFQLGFCRLWELSYVRNRWEVDCFFGQLDFWFRNHNHRLFYLEVFWPENGIKIDKNNANNPNCERSERYLIDSDYRRKFYLIRMSKSASKMSISDRPQTCKKAKVPNFFPVFESSKSKTFDLPVSFRLHLELEL